MALNFGDTMKYPLILMALSAISNPLFATSLHFSPEIKMGPYFGAGISGAGAQVGVADKLGVDAIYLSYSHTSAEFLNYDKDRLKTYRIGTQYQLIERPKMALQLEVGVVEYNGSRRIIGSTDRRKRSGNGLSTAASWVVFINPNVGFRTGVDINYVNKSNTYLAGSLSGIFSTGVVFQF